MPVMTPDGTCNASIDEAISKVSSQSDPELIVSPGEHTITRTIDRPITIRSSRARSYTRPDPTDFVSIDCPVMPGFAGSGLGSMAADLEHEPKVILRAASPENGILIDMGEDEHRMAFIGVELHGLGKGPSVKVRRGKIGIVQSRVFAPVVVMGEKSRAVLLGARLSGDPISIFDGQTVDTANNWQFYDVVGACDEALLVVKDGATVNSVGLELTDHSPLGICVDGARANLCGGSIHGIRFDDQRRLGRGAQVKGGGSLALRSVDIYDVYEAGIVAKETGTELNLEGGTTVSDIHWAGYSDVMASIGIALEDGAVLAADDAAIVDLWGPGMWLTGGSEATAKNLTISSVEGAGIAVFDAKLSLTSSNISEIPIACNMGGGYGVYVDSQALGPASVEITDTIIADVLSSGIIVLGDGGNVKLTGGSISGTYGNERTVGYDGRGLTAIDVCSGLTVDGVAFENNVAGHINLHGSNATLSSIVFASTGYLNSDFVQQRCTEACVTTLSTGDLSAAGITDPPNTIEICPYYDSLILYDDLTLIFTLAEIEG